VLPLAGRAQAGGSPVGLDREVVSRAEPSVL